ncbi:hypothetical protein EDB92DRAFT_1815940 [Lactarius akahatsu]|uniref:Uncharacterized protein n=1 Tax=Lactarius akahatsu TaxID=416441 RepID=A0AAD4LMA3_9AGAM|nr:hypothetical protein EDB92DRAFT_1815940 [Lactarius akahatsu]
MATTPLDALTSYTTPIQPDPNTERGNTSGQKRKRNPRDTRDTPERNTQGPGQNDANNTNTPLTQPRPISHPHTPSPSPARPLPVFNLPQFNNEHSPPQPPSPTSEAQKRRRTQTQNSGEQNQTEEREMETPARMRGEPQENDLDNADPQPEENTVEIDEQENAKMLARIMAASDNSPDLDNGTPFLNPLDRYTKGPMPDIHDKDPATLLAGIDKTQIGSWLAATTGKVLARPFDNVANYQPHHKNIAKVLMAAAKEITGAASATVAPPNKEKERPNLRQRGKRHPITFLIHGISKKDVETLLERKVWSSKEITFQVALININRPKFLFTLNGLAMQEETHIAPILAATWNDPVTCTFLQKLANRAPEPEQNNTMSILVKFLESTTITRLDIKTEGGKDDPHFNIYADGDIIEDDKTWVELRRHLRSLPYNSAMLGEGRAIRDDYICGLCHAHDHPRGLCPFPVIPGWNGGGRNQKKPSNNIPHREIRTHNGQPSRENHHNNHHYNSTNHSNRN